MKLEATTVLTGEHKKNIFLSGFLHRCELSRVCWFEGDKDNATGWLRSCNVNADRLEAGQCLQQY